MTELLALRHEVFCVEQGVPEREELDGRDGEGVHLVAVAGRRGAGDLPSAVRRADGPVQPPGGAARRAPARDRVRGCWRSPTHETRDGGGPADRAARPDLRAVAVRGAPATSRAVGCSWSPGSSTSRWRSCCSAPELRIDPLPGSAIIAGERAGRRRCSVDPAESTQRPLRRTRRRRRSRSAASGGDRRTPDCARGSCRSSTGAAPRARARRRSRTCSGRARRAARTS